MWAFMFGFHEDVECWAYGSLKETQTQIKSPDSSQHQQLKALGEFWWNELNCAACHSTDSNVDHRIIPIRKDSADSRHEMSGLSDFLLSSPIPAFPGGHPDLLPPSSSGLRDLTALSISFWITGNRELPTTSFDSKSENRIKDEDIQAGRRLFNEVGCQLCHLTNSNPTAEPKAPLISRPLEAFLPIIPKAMLRLWTQTHESEAAPDFNLSEDENRQISAYLITLRESFLVKDPMSNVGAGNGDRWFRRLGCAQCHSNPVDSSTTLRRKNFSLSKKHLSRLNHGCMSEAPKRPAPDFDLNTIQRQSLQTWLSSESNQSPQTESSAGIHHLILLSQHGCLNCHERNGEGGRLSELKDRFPDGGDDLGPAGRFPPPLNEAGRKFQPGILESILAGHPESHVRPYLKVRSPGYSEEVVSKVATALREMDQDPEERPTPRDGRENEVGRNAWGRELIGATGLGCIVCHPLNGNPAMGIQAVDLASAPERLRPEWFRDMLLDPSRFRPETRMPVFWPNGRPTRSGLGGSAERQIDSIWVYLNELSQSRLPKGMESEELFVVQPTDRPKVMRTFLQNSGTHGIVVGFPEGTHLGMDALNLRWTLVWTGEFIDAEGIWDNRFTPETQPLGTVLYEIQRFTTAVKKDSLSGAEFYGYQTRGTAAPVFEYQLGTAILQDRLYPDNQQSPGTLIRSLNLQSNQTGSTPTPVWWEIANGAQIQSISQDQWLVDEAFIVEWIQPANDKAQKSVNKDKARWRIVDANENESTFQSLQLLLECGHSSNLSLIYRPFIQDSPQ